MATKEMPVWLPCQIIQQEGLGRGETQGSWGMVRVHAGMMIEVLEVLLIHKSSILVMVLSARLMTERLTS